MFLKSGIRFPNTTKFKMTLWYGALFLAAFVLVYLVIYVLLKANMTKRSDQELLGLADKFESQYLKGKDDDVSRRSFSGNVPEVVANVAEKAIENLRIGDVRQIKENGRLFYEVVGNSDSTRYEIKITPEGRVVEIEESSSLGEMELLEKDFIEEARYEGVSGIFFMLTSPNGKVLAKSDLSMWPKLKIAQAASALSSKTTVTWTAPGPKDGSDARIIARRFFDGNIFMAGVNLSADRILLETYTSIFGVMAVTAFLLSLSAAWLIAGRAMAGVNRVSETAARIGHGNLDERVPIGNEGEEINNLARAFNDMLARIHALVVELKEMSDNVAHDLRTPLTRIRGVIETTVSRNDSIDGYRDMCADVIEECDRLMEIINTTLEITQMDSGEFELTHADVDVGEIVTRAHQLFLPMAEAENIDFQASVPEEKLIVSGDETRLQRLVANLIDNALKYTQKNGRASLTVSRSHHFVKVEARDNGRGIPPEERDRIFDRFYRCDASRSLPGNGLGLSLAKSIAIAHQGTISVVSSSGEGTTFIVELPLAPSTS